MTELSSTNRYAYDTECRSETQTRSRKCRGDGTCDTFTGWSGSYKYDDPGCSNQPGTLRDDYTQHERVKWQDALVYVTPEGGEGCVFEFQHRVGESGTRSFTAWSGSYGFDACTEVARDKDLEVTHGCSSLQRQRGRLFTSQVATRDGDYAITSYTYILDNGDPTQPYFQKDPDTAWSEWVEYVTDTADTCITDASGCEDISGWISTYAVNPATYGGFSPATDPGQCGRADGVLCILGGTPVMAPFVSDTCVDVATQRRYKAVNSEETCLLEIQVPYSCNPHGESLLQL